MNYPEIRRYIVNGLVATVVHFGVLTFNIEVLHLHSAGVANLIAACFGISTSFLGSRYFVFRNLQRPMITQASLFVGLYAAIALLHGLFLLGWTDVLGHDYRAGFVVATGLQVLMSYLGNKYLVFRS
jgi:putative flippase GtrA